MSTLSEMAVNPIDHPSLTSNGHGNDDSPKTTPPATSQQESFTTTTSYSTITKDVRFIPNGIETVPYMYNGDTSASSHPAVAFDRSDSSNGDTTIYRRKPTTGAPNEDKNFLRYDLNIDVSLLENVEAEERVIGHSPDNRFLKYDLEIGRGSFKTVYKGVDTETGVAVAWCELMESKFDKTEQMRFKDEVKILKTLNNPYILRLYDSWEYTHTTDKKRVLVLITELMTSGTLKGYMKRLKSIKPRMIRSWGRQILKGLHFLHTRTPPIIHRDLKCDNIFINGTTGVVKIGDLGLATLKRSDVKTVIGTPEFMAPEMYEELYDESVDIYAFGMCLIEMTTGEYPYKECQNPAQIFKRVTNGVLPQALVKIEDPAMREVIEGCIRGEKRDRFNVKNLLDHEFFAEGELKVEVVEDEGSKGDITFRMEVPNRENKKESKHESVEFSYSLHSDVPESVVEEMIKSGLLREEDRKNVIRTVREHVGTQKKRLQNNPAHSTDTTSGSTLSAGGESKSDLTSVSNIDTLTTSIDNENPPKLQHQQSVSSESDIQELAKPHENNVPIHRDSVTEETLVTPPVSTQSSPSLQIKNSELSIVQEESEDDKSIDSEGEEKKGINKNKIEKERLTRRDSHPIDDPNKGKDTKKASEDGPLPSVSNGGKGDIDTTTGSGDSTSRLQDTLSSANDINIESTSSQDQQGSSDHSSSGVGGRKKTSRNKESKKQLRLKLTDRYSTGVVSCSLCVGDRTVNFKFSTEYDRPKEIFQNILKAAHVTKKDEEEFIKKLTEIIDSIKKGECSIPIKEGPEGGSKGENNKNGDNSKTTDSMTDVPISRSRAGSTKQSSKDEPSSDSKDSKTETQQHSKPDKKDGMEKSKRRNESVDHQGGTRTPLILSQSSSESVSTLSPNNDSHPGLASGVVQADGIHQSSYTGDHPGLSSKATPTSTSHLPSSQLVSSSTPSLQANSTTVIQTADKKRFEIEDVSFTNEDGFSDPPEVKGTTGKGGLDSETASQCGGLESASTNSMQSDSHVIPDSFQQTEGSNLHSAPPPNYSGHSGFMPQQTPPTLPDNKDLYNGLAKFLYLMSNMLKDPEVMKLTSLLDQQFGPQGPTSSSHAQHPVHGHTPFNQHMGLSSGSMTTMTPYPSQTHLSSSDQIDGGVGGGGVVEGDIEYEEYCQQVQKEFEEKEKRLREEKQQKLKRFYDRRTNYHSSEPPLTGSTSQPGHMMSGGVATSATPTVYQQHPVIRSKTSTGGGDLHPSMYQTMDQREQLYHPNNSSHSPSRDLTTQQSQPNPQGLGGPPAGGPQGLGPPPTGGQHPSYPTANMSQSGQQQPQQQGGGASNYYSHERYVPQPSQQNQNPIPNQGQVSIPNQGIPNQSQIPIQNQGQVPIPNQTQVPNQQGYPPYMYIHHQNHPPPMTATYPQSGGGYHMGGGGMYPQPSNGTYPSGGFMNTRVPDLPSDGDHQNSITKKR